MFGKTGQSVIYAISTRRSGICGYQMSKVTFKETVPDQKGKKGKMVGRRGSLRETAPLNHKVAAQIKGQIKGTARIGKNLDERPDKSPLITETPGREGELVLDRWEEKGNGAGETLKKRQAESTICGRKQSRCWPSGWLYRRVRQDAWG